MWRTKVSKRVRACACARRGDFGLTRRWRGDTGVVVWAVGQAVGGASSRPSARRCTLVGCTLVVVAVPLHPPSTPTWINRSLPKAKIGRRNSGTMSDWGRGVG